MGARYQTEFLTARLPMLCYADFQRQGLPIGSGAVESACKLVVEARLKGSGMHWARSHVTPMVALRAACCSHRWQQTWPAIHRQLRLQAHDQHLRRLLHAPPSAPPVPALASPPPKRKVHLSVAHRRMRAATPPKIVNGRPTDDHPFRRAIKTAG